MGSTLEARVLDAADRDDYQAFLGLCARHGTETCQSIVRTKGNRTRPMASMTLAGGAATMPTTSASSPARGARLRLPESAWTDLEILLTDDAIRDLSRTTQWGTGNGTLEAADWLLGIATNHTALIAAASPATKAQSESLVHLDVRPANDALKLRENGNQIALVGDCHFQPNTSTPSNVDFEGWERGFRTINKDDYQPVYVGLIATGRPASPTFHGWATRMVDGQLVTRPAAVRGI